MIDLKKFKNWKYLNMVRPEYQKLILKKKVISYKKYLSMRANSYERFWLEQLLTDEGVTKAAEYAIKNSSYGHMVGLMPTTYDDALVSFYVPMLIERLKSKAKCQEKAKDIMRHRYAKEVG